MFPSEGAVQELEVGRWAYYSTLESIPLAARQKYTTATGRT